MPKRFWVFTFIVFVLTAPTVPAFADSTSVSPEKLAAAALNQFGGTAATVRYMNGPGRVQPSVDAAVADTSLAARYGSALLGASTFTVTSIGDGGDAVPGDGVCGRLLPFLPCTFRAAIEEANAHAGLDVIHFGIGTGVRTIMPASPLPTITDPVIIDGTTQPGFAGTPIIELNGASAGVGASGPVISAGGSTVRGLVINRFWGRGIWIATNGGNVVEGNFIGTDVTGTLDRGNSDGVFINGSPNNTIGGTTAGARNVISGNNGFGMDISGSTSTGNQVMGNFIGTDVTGTLDLGNSSDGVFIFESPNNTIGGTTAAARNVISGNNRSGVEISSTATGNKITYNSIFSNSLLGIELRPPGVTPNDAGDGDAGANNLQNFPVLSSAFSVGANTTIQGMLNSTANDSFRLEFFSNDSCDSSDYGEGQTFLGSTNVMTNGSGNASFNFTFPVSVPVGQFITATATDSAGNTSEFCQCRAVCAAAKGDMNASGNLSPADAVSMLNCVFMASGNCALCFADVNCSGDLTSSDVVLELNAVFLGQTAPPWCGN